MLIILDIDGVLLPAKPWLPLPILADGFYAFNPKSVAVLNEILTLSKATITLSTSHKYSFSIKHWITIFKNRGIDIKAINRLPENLDNISRKQEIVNWISESKLSKGFVIIDDDKSLNNLPIELKDKLILTQSMIGLTEFHVKEFTDKMIV